MSISAARASSFACNKMCDIHEYDNKETHTSSSEPPPTHLSFGEAMLPDARHLCQKSLHRTKQTNHLPCKIVVESVVYLPAATSVAHMWFCDMLNSRCRTSASSYQYCRSCKSCGYIAAFCRCTCMHARGGNVSH